MIETKATAVHNASIQLMEAWKKKDFEGLNDLLHKDFQFVSAHIQGWRYNKLQWLDVAINKYKVYHYRYEFLNFIESNCVGVSLSKLTLLSSVTFNNTPNHYLVTDVWKHDQNTWKLLLREPVLLM